MHSYIFVGGTVMFLGTIAGAAVAKKKKQPPILHRIQLVILIFLSYLSIVVCNWRVFCDNHHKISLDSDWSRTDLIVR